MPAGPGGAAGGGGMWNSPGGPNVVTMANAGRTGRAGLSEHGFTPRPVVLPMGATRWSGRDAPLRTGPPHPQQPLGGAGLVAGEAGYSVGTEAALGPGKQETNFFGKEWGQVEPELGAERREGSP